MTAAGQEPPLDLLRTLAQGTRASVLIKVLGAALVFGAQVVMARLLGPAQYGAYVYALSWVLLLALIGRLGYDVALVRFVPQYMALQQWDLLRGLARHSSRAVLTASLIVGMMAAALFAVAPLRLEEWTRPFYVVAFLAIPAVAFLYLMQGALRGMLLTARAELLDSVIRPAAMVAAALLAAVFFARPLSATLGMGAHLFGVLAALGVGTIWLWRAAAAGIEPGAPAAAVAQWRAVAWPLMLMSGMSLILGQTDIVVVGAIVGAEAAGMYAAATRIAQQIVFLLTATEVILGPLIARLFATGDHVALQRLLTWSARRIAALALPIGMLLLLLRRPLLTLYGEAFVAAAMPMAVLIGGKLVNAMTGSVALLLNMTGYQRYSAAILAGTVVLNLGLSLWLTPRYGIMGAAVGTGISIVTWNLVMLAVVRAKLGYNTTVFGKGSRS